MSCYIVSTLWLVGWAAAQQPPAWLYAPPQHPRIIFSAGMSPLYRTDSLSYRSARFNALEGLGKQYQVRIISKRAERRSTGRSISYGYTLELVDSLVYIRCFLHAATVDSMIRGNHAYILLAIQEDLSNPETSEFQTTDQVPLNSDPPEWVYRMPHQQGYLYGVGVSLPYRHVGDAWANSAKQARREIALTLEAQKSYFENEQVAEGGTTYDKWSEGQTQITLTHCLIKERWYDPKEQLYYTLIEYKLPE